MKQIPNLITSFNLAAGFLAIIFTAGGEIVISSWIIFAAMIFDFLDGFSARMLKAYSAIGKELDSLADVVSFGVAPGFIIYSLITASLPDLAIHAGDSINIKALGIMIISVLMPACAAYRLAIFNIDTSQATTFKGLPTPANAFAVISLVIAGHYSHSPVIISLTGSPVFLAAVTIILSFLMVSRFPLLSLKFSNLRLKGNEGRLIFVSLVLVTLVIFGISSAPLIIPVYITASFLSRFF